TSHSKLILCVPVLACTTSAPVPFSLNTRPFHGFPVNLSKIIAQKNANVHSYFDKLRRFIFMASFQNRGTKKKPSWQYTISRMVNGKPAPIRKGGFKTKAEAEAAAAEIEQQLRKGKIGR